MVQRDLLLMLLALLLSAPACDDETGDDDTTPSGDDDDAAPGHVNASVLDSLDDAIGGPLRGAVVGDVLVENDRIRIVLQQPGRALALNPYGGNIIDADVVRDDGLDHDRWGEVGLFINSTITCAPETMEIVSDGSDGAAVVRFTGPAARAEGRSALTRERSASCKKAQPSSHSLSSCSHSSLRFAAVLSARSASSRVA